MDSKEKKQRWTKEYYEKHPEFLERDKETKKRWRQRNREYLSEQGRHWLTKNPEQTLVLHSRGRAKKQGLEHTITKEDITIPTHCPYLGIRLNPDRVEGEGKYRASLDRIDSTKGYIPDNIEVVSWLANTMKSNATKEELISFALGVLSKLAPEKLKDGYETYPLVVED